jgi:macrolide transport system ATP-binding/permease protein
MSAWRWLFGRRRADAELAREIDAHIAERVDDLVDEGWSEPDAKAQARREFGNKTLQIERSREVWIAPWLSSVWQDLRYAARSMVRQPGFAVSVIGILALGIGPVTALFSMFNGRVLRPWPVRDPSSIAIVMPIPGPKEQYGRLSNVEYRYLREHTRTVTHLATWTPGGGPIAYGKTNTSVQWNFVSANYFDMLGVGMHIGRGFLAEEEDYTSPRAVAVISERLWREYFGAPASILGDTILVYGHPFTIVGVAEAGFFDIERHIRRDVWMPRPSVALALASFSSPAVQLKELADPRRGGVERAAGRLAPGISRAAALAELDVLGRQFRSTVPMDAHGYRLHDTRPVSLDPNALSRQLPVLRTVFGALMLVMLLACANAGNLILARGLARQRELAIRLSLGAGRARVTRQLLTEALLMSVLASAVGLGLGAFALRILTLSTGTPLLANPDPYVPDLLVVVFTIAMAFLACLAASVLPAWRTTRISIAARSGESGAGRPGAGRLRTTLLAVQLALSMVLLVAAGLLTRAVGHAMTLDPGFAIHESQALSLRLPAGATRERSAVFHRTLRDALEAGQFPPLAFSELTAITTSHRTIPFRQDDDGRGTTRALLARDVSARYFSVLDIPLVAGRTLADDERAHEIVVNQSAARLFWPDSDPLGKRLVSGNGEAAQRYTVVGITKDVPVTTLSEIPPVVYRSLQSGGLVLVRDLSPAIVERIAAVARGIEPKVELAARPLADDIWMATRDVATASRFASMIGLFALILATVGAFGVFAYSVEERRREIGVRMALGAQAPQVVWTVIGGARWPLLGGVGAGLLLSSAATPLLRRFLYGLTPFDPITYLATSAILMAAALVATWVPAQRAIRIDPAITLRAD